MVSPDVVGVGFKKKKKVEPRGMGCRFFISPSPLRVATCSKAARMLFTCQFCGSGDGMSTLCPRVHSSFILDFRIPPSRWWCQSLMPCTYSTSTRVKHVGKRSKQKTWYHVPGSNYCVRLDLSIAKLWNAWQRLVGRHAQDNKYSLVNILKHWKHGHKPTLRPSIHRVNVLTSWEPTNWS